MGADTVLFRKKTSSEQNNKRFEDYRRNVIYKSARSQMALDTISGYQFAIQKFQIIRDWKDSEEQIGICEKRIREIEILEASERLERKRREEEARIAAERAEKRRRIALAVAAAFLLLCIAFVVLYATVIRPNRKLNDAYALLNAGEYEAASALLDEIENKKAVAANRYRFAVASIDSGEYEAAFMLLSRLNYRDSASLMEQVRPKYRKSLFSKAQIGSSVVIGTYEQDNNPENGAEDIEWLVLDRDGDKILIISRYAIECRKYQDTYDDHITWEACALRKWLNEDFMSTAFRADERDRIQSTLVKADRNPLFDVPPGNDTVDKVFLLSIPEALLYFRSDSSRQCTATEYVKGEGAFTHYINGNCWWWLRSPGSESAYAAYVLSDGSVYFSGGYGIGRGSIAVRPAMWIDIGA